MSGEGLLAPGAAPILLASASATRRTLLEAAGLPVECEPSGVDERAVEARLGSRDPATVAAALADAKAEAVSRRRPDRVVIGADQVLACGDELFSKAANAAEACEGLLRLSGRTHELVSAASVARGGGVEARVLGSARLTMRPLGREALARYVALAGPAATRSVGGFEVEGLGIHLFERIEGEHATILGLPMLALLSELRRLGLLAF